MNKWLIFKLCSFLVVTIFAPPSQSARLGEPCEHHSDCGQEVRSPGHIIPLSLTCECSPLVSWCVTLRCSPVCAALARGWGGTGPAVWTGRGRGWSLCLPHPGRWRGTASWSSILVISVDITQPKTYAARGFSRISEEYDRKGSTALPGQGITVKVTDAWRQGSSAENYKGRCPEFKTGSQKQLRGCGVRTQSLAAGWRSWQIYWECGHGGNQGKWVEVEAQAFRDEQVLYICLFIVFATLSPLDSQFQEVWVESSFFTLGIENLLWWS